MLRFETWNMPAADLNGESTLPLLSSFYDTIHTPKTKLGDDDGLYIGYGFVNSAFPYRSLDNYSRELKNKEFMCAVLENENLKASFLPELGGRLWSLIDKKTGRDLLFTNPVLRFGYLATRNAWFSGGVEWNCGVFGHHGLTCEPLFTAVLKDESGEPVLRMYEYERIRSVVYQMDFTLPEGAAFLQCRMRIENFDEETKPIYWWSNIAIPEIYGARVIVPADETYTHDDDGFFTKLSLPYRDGTDITYPTNQIISRDNFWKTRKDKRKYICQLDKDGYGIVQMSTSLLKGRKLFVWGQKEGGARWQEYLSGAGSAGRYCEIQAGLAHTQHESLPLPPKTAWEWMEFYGPLNASANKVHGTWQEAREEVESRLEEIFPAEKQEKMLAATKKTALTKADKVIMTGNGWGALENARRAQAGQSSMPEHLDFILPYGDAKNKPQEQWYCLLNNGHFPSMQTSDVLPSWMLQNDWVCLMEKAAAQSENKENKDDWYLYLQLGVSYCAMHRQRDAYEALTKSLELRRSPWALYALGENYRMQGDSNKYVDLLTEAANESSANGCWDISLVKKAAAAMYQNGSYSELYNFTDKLPKEVGGLPRILLYRAFAAVHTGRYIEAENILYADGGLVVPDIKEGEVSMSELWYLIQEAKACASGTSFDRKNAEVPKQFDFRMH